MADRSGLSIEGQWENGLMEGEMKIETDEGIPYTKPYFHVEYAIKT